ncbi:hypothetical protein [Glutamicibacter arilaitensis]
MKIILDFSGKVTPSAGYELRRRHVFASSSIAMALLEEFNELLALVLG